VAGGGGGGVPRAEDVVQDRLARRDFEEVDVFVRRGVEDELRPVAREEVVHPFGVANVPDHLDEGLPGGLLPQVEPQVHQAVLAVIEGDEPRRPEAGELPAELRPDRAPRPGHQDRPSAHPFLDPLDVDGDRLAPEQVLDPHLADLPQRPLPGDKVGQRRDGAALDPRVLAELDNLPHEAGRRGGRGDQHLADAPLRDQARDVEGRAEHAEVLDPPPLLLRVVVHEADRHAGVALRPAQVASDHRADIPRPDDQDAAPPAARGAQAGCAHHLPGETTAADQDRREDPGEHDDARREEADLRDQVEHEGGREPQGQGADQDEEGRHPGVAPEGTVDPGQIEEEEERGRIEEGGADIGVDVLGRYPAVEPESKRRHERRVQQNGVDDVDHGQLEPRAHRSVPGYGLPLNFAPPSIHRPPRPGQTGNG